MSDAAKTTDELVAELQELRARLGAFEQDSARLLETQKLESLGVLAGGIAHDFNNLLMAVLGNADMAAAQLPEDHPARANLQQISAASRRAADLTSQLLAYAGKARFEMRPTDLNAVIAEMAHLLKTSTNHAATPTYHLSARLPAVRADAAQVRQVAMNLITNAAESIGAGAGVIRIATDVRHVDAAFLATCVLGADLPPGEYVALEVSDTGAGMDEATRARIFEPFFSTKFAGRGLGLAAVHGIVRVHRGALHAASAPGAGATITVLFPPLEDSARAAAGAAPYETEELGAVGRLVPAGQERAVLLVDDDTNVREVTRLILRQLGFSVVVAHDGLEAVERYRELHSRLACVLLDLVMPRMRGDTALAEMVQIDPAVPVLLMSGYNVAEINQQLEGHGAAGFLQKPFTMQRLRAALALVLAG